MYCELKSIFCSFGLTNRYTLVTLVFDFHFLRCTHSIYVEVPYKGPVEATINEILGGVRSTCTYVGASRLKELPKRTTFIRCTQQLNPVFNQMKQVTKRAAEAYGMDGKSKKQKN